MSDVRLYHGGTLARVIVSGGASIPCRVDSVGDWAGSNRWVDVTITARRAAGGYEYPAGHRLTLHGNSVWPREVTDPAIAWVWCDGKAHSAPCPDCGDVHRVRDAIPGRVMGGVWVSGATVERCRACNRMTGYRPERATR